MSLFTLRTQCWFESLFACLRCFENAERRASNASSARFCDGASRLHCFTSGDCVGSATLTCVDVGRWPKWWCPKLKVWWLPGAGAADEDDGAGAAWDELAGGGGDGAACDDEAGGGFAAGREDDAGGAGALVGPEEADERSTLVGTPAELEALLVLAAAELAPADEETT
jgi:hypothetical protein